MTIEEKAIEIIKRLNEKYPFDNVCYLHYDKPYELLIATVLSAQCTDDRVNLVTKDLFAKYTSYQSFARADLVELERDIHSIGFYHNKAKNIVGAMQMLEQEFDGILPSDINVLVRFPGVGRKTANILRGHIYGIPGVAVDTHVKRISKKLGLTDNTDPVKIESDLMKILPVENWISYNTQIIAHGRAVCKARKPDCENCFLCDLCNSVMS